jgi:type IV secretion system protein TrbL
MTKLYRLLILPLLPIAVAYGQLPGLQAPPVTIPTITDPTTIVNFYQAAVGQWLTTAQQYSAGLFFMLASIEMAWTGLTFAFDRISLEAGVAAAFKKMSAMVFFAMLMTNAVTWMPMIINTFVQMGKTASGIPSLGPSQVLVTGVNIASSLLWSAGSSSLRLDFLNSLAFMFAAALVFASFLVVCAHFIVCLVNTYLAVGIGMFFTWLGGSRWTVQYVERFFAFTVSAALQLMTMYLVAGIGLTLAQSWITLAQNTAATWGGAMSGWIIAAGAVIYAVLCWYLPRIVAAKLGGSPSMSLGDLTALSAPVIGVAAAVGSAAASGGAAIAASAPIAAVVAVGAATGGVGGSSSGGGNSPGPGSSSSSSGHSGGGSPGPGIGQIASNLARGLPSSGGGGSPPHGSIGH